MGMLHSRWICSWPLSRLVICISGHSLQRARVKQSGVVWCRSVRQKWGCEMSFGFARRPKKARRLKNLQISEVSSVDVGAGYGVNVVLAKRDTGHVERKE